MTPFCACHKDHEIRLQTGSGSSFSPDRERAAIRGRTRFCLICGYFLFSILFALVCKLVRHCKRTTAGSSMSCNGGIREDEENQRDERRQPRDGAHPVGGPLKGKATPRISNSLGAPKRSRLDGPSR